MSSCRAKWLNHYYSKRRESLTYLNGVITQKTCILRSWNVWHSRALLGFDSKYLCCRERKRSGWEQNGGEGWVHKWKISLHIYVSPIAMNAIESAQWNRNCSVTSTVHFPLYPSYSLCLSLFCSYFWYSACTIAWRLCIANPSRPLQLQPTVKDQ